MKRKMGLSPDQHRQLAGELLAMRDKIQKIHMQICNSYGVSKKICKSASRLKNDLSTFISDIDNAFFEDLGPDAPGSPYYPMR
jgi:hypothetical protein